MTSELERDIQQAEKRAAERGRERLAEADAKIYIEPRRETQPSWKDVIWFMVFAAVCTLILCGVLIWKSR